MSDVAAIETQRLQLESNITKLKTDLRTWETWDLEYDELKEVLQPLPANTDNTQLVALADNYDATCVTRQVVREVLGLDKPPVRTPQQACDLLSKRQEYVGVNIDTLTKRLQDAEMSLADIGPDYTDDTDMATDGSLPICDIVEQLDDDDHVISSKLIHPEAASERILEALEEATAKKEAAGAGPLNDPALSSRSSIRASSSDADDTDSHSSRRMSSASFSSHSEVDSASVLSSSTKSSSRPASQGRKKSVSFAEDTKAPAVEISRPSSSASNRSDQKSVSWSPVVEHIEPLPTTDGTIDATDALDAKSLSKTVVESDDDSMVDAVIPGDESPEDAQLRREMLAYSLNEVGSIVAEMDLDDGYSDDDNLSDHASMSDVDDDDQYGRSTKPVLSEQYRKRMLELEEKLDARMVKNIGPAPAEDMDLDPTHAHRLVIRDTPDASTSVDADGKKSVRFADTLDIRHLDNKTASPHDNNDTTSADIQKQSRFNRARNAPSQQATEPRTTILDDVTERDTSILSTSAPAAPSDLNDPHEIDSELQRRQLATEYYRLRNTLIRQQEDGFKESPQEAYEPLMEERDDGRVKKVSRFKAARVQGGMS